MKENRRPDFARAMAIDGLVEIVRHYPDCRDRVLNGFSEHLKQPDTGTIRRGSGELYKNCCLRS